MPTYPPMEYHLETERLRLRPWQPDDAEPLQALHAERGEGTHPVERAAARIAGLLAATAESGIALLPIERRAEGDVIGYCGLILGRSTLEEPELAYELSARAHGNGYATEAARAVVAAAAATGRARLWATIRPWNAASFRVVEKLGFERGHLSRDERGDIVWMSRTLP